MTLEAWELDQDFVPALRGNLEACAKALRSVGIRATAKLHSGSYVEDAASVLDSGLFHQSEVASFTHAILNPPYRKIANQSRERKLLRNLGMETSNLYAAFVWLALRQLVEGGELTAVTPRSFCNGPYFRAFRRDLMASAVFHRIHVFNSRSEAFGRDEVLQENVLFHFSRSQGARPLIIVSTGNLDSRVEVRTAADRVVRADDPDRVIHLATETNADKVCNYIQSLPCQLEELGIGVSTGPVVDFRLKNALSHQLRESDVPLLYPHCVKPGRVLPPLADSADYGDSRIARKPVAIEVNDDTRRWLLPSARFVLTKRFTSKEEKRRLVAGVIDPKDFSESLIGLENHLNFLHRNRQGLSQFLAQGLCRFLNSTVADQYFRQFNGHTQVNATDLRALRYPDQATLEHLGRLNLDDSDPVAIDLAMTCHLGAPSVA